MALAAAADTMVVAGVSLGVRVGATVQPGWDGAEAGWLGVLLAAVMGLGATQAIDLGVGVWARLGEGRCGKRGAGGGGGGVGGADWCGLGSSSLSRSTSWAWDVSGYQVLRGQGEDHRRYRASQD